MDCHPHSHLDLGPGNDLDPYHHPHHVIVTQAGVDGGNEGVENGRRSREEKKKRKKQQATSPKNKREKGGEGADGEKRSREQRFLGSNSVSERTKERAGKSEQNKKSPQSLGGHSVASMRRRRERGGCPATGEGLFPDITTGCQVNFSTFFLIFQMIPIIRSSTCVTTVIEWASSLVREGLFSPHSMRPVTGRGR